MPMQSQQNFRVLSMYDRVRNGQSLNKKEEAAHFQVGEKTIQRAIESIRSFLEMTKTEEYLEYDRMEKVYRLFTAETQGHSLNSAEVLAISKVLIDSRAFTKIDMNQVLSKLIDCVKEEERDFIDQVLSNEKHLYVDLQHQQSVFELLSKLAKAIQYKKVCTIRYKKEFDNEDQERVIKPVGLLFSEYYFYLIAYQTTVELAFPTIYRVDRITSCKVMGKRFKIPYGNRFQEGEFRKRIQFMHAGELMTVTFCFTGPSVQAVLDRLPTARILSADANCTIFEAEVFGHGIKMWLLSQGANLEVLKPEELRLDMAETVRNMVGLYK